MLIILSGLPGVGKTTLARALARATGAVHVRIDSIEAAVLDSALAPGSVEDAGYRAAYAIARDNARLGLTVIADSVNPLEITREAWREVARAACVPFLEVEVLCADRAEHRRRVEQRTGDIQGRALPTWAGVVGRDYAPWTGDRLVLDTAAMTLAQAVDTVTRAMARGRARSVLVITGSMGAGKTTVMAEASDLLTEAAVRHAAIDFDALSVGISSESVAYRNLRAVTDNFAVSGCERLLVAAAIERPSALQELRSAAGASAPTVCRLRASVTTMQQRVRVREPGMLQQQFVDRVAVLERTLDDAAVEDFSVVNDGRGVTEVAREMLVRAGWLPSL